MRAARIVGRSDPERIFMSFRNMYNTGVANPQPLVYGDVVQLAVTGDTYVTGYTLQPGVDVLRSAGVDPTVAGVVAKSEGIPFGEIGPIQVYGFHPSVKTTVAALAVDTVVTANAAGAAVVRAIAALGDIDDQELGVCIVTGAGNLAGIFIKTM